VNNFSGHNEHDVEDDNDDEGQGEHVHVLGLLGSGASELQPQHGSMSQRADEVYVAVGQCHQGYPYGTDKVGPAVRRLKADAEVIARAAEKYLVALLCTIPLTPLVHYAFHFPTVLACKRLLLLLLFSASHRLHSCTTFTSSPLPLAVTHALSHFPLHSHTRHIRGHLVGRSGRLYPNAQLTSQLTI
jgi:hypothetical protein